MSAKPENSAGMKKTTGKVVNVSELKKGDFSSTTMALAEQIAVLKAKLSHSQDRAEKAEEQMHRQGQVLATVSHELRTPLGAIINLAEILTVTELDECQNDYATSLKNSATGLLHVLNDLLDHSRLESGKCELAADTFNIRKLIDEVVDIQAVQCREKGLALRLDVASSMPEELYGDAPRIRQVLLNLLNNAVKFTASGTIDLSVGISGAGKPHRVVEFSVKDTGIGLSEALRDRIFAPYVQADENISTRFGGTGLGLSICRQLVLMMDGDIGYNSKVGHGAEFWFTVTCKPAAPDRDAKPVEEQDLADVLALEHQRCGKILVVEDNRTNRLLISTYLEKFGHTFEIVTSGAQALEIIEKRKFDIILMDVKMPDMDGIETTRRIRQSKGDSRSIPIIALTANAMYGDRKKYLDAGMDAYVSKPIQAAKLFHAIDKTLENALN